MVVKEKVEFFRQLIIVSCQEAEAHQAMVKLIADAKVYQDAFITPMQTGLGDRSDAGMYLEEGASRQSVESGCKTLKKLGVYLPEMPLDTFCETLISAADGV